MAGIDLALGGAVKRGVDSGIAYQEDRDNLNQQRQRETEMYGINKELATDQLTEHRRAKGNEDAYLADFGKGATWETLANNAYQRGDMANYQQFKAHKDLAEKEGFTKALQMSFMDGITPDQLKEAYNAAGSDKIDDVRVENVLDDKGKVVDMRITPIKDGQPRPTFSRNRAAQFYGVLPKEEYEVKDGYYFSKSGRTAPVALPERGKQFAPNTYFEKIEETSADGTKRQRLIDLRSGNDVTPEGKHIENGISRQDNESILSSAKALYKISDLESMDDTGRAKLGQVVGIATQLYKSGAVDRQGRKLSTNEVTAIASDVVDGRLKPEDAQRQYLPKGGKVSAPAGPEGAAPAGGATDTEAAPMEGARKAKDGSWYVQKDGQWFRVNAAAAASGAPIQPQPQRAAVTQPAPAAAQPAAFAPNEAAQQYIDLRDRAASLKQNVGLPGGPGIASGKRDASINRELADIDRKMQSLRISPEEADRYDAQRRIADLDKQIAQIPQDSPTGRAQLTALQDQKAKLVANVEKQSERAREMNRNTVMTQPGIAAPTAAADAPTGGISADLAPQPPNVEPQPAAAQPPAPGIQGGIIPVNAPTVSAPVPPARGIDKSTWDKRGDGSTKGTGFLGVQKRPDGKVSSELSIGVNIDGKEMEIPTMVPGLSKDEVSTLLNLQPGQKIPKGIVDKAVSHAKSRMAAGKSVFADDSESPKASTAAPSKATAAKPLSEPEYRDRMSFGANSPTDYINKVTPYINSEAPKRLGAGDIDWLKKWMPWMAKADPQRAVRYVRAINDTIRGGGFGGKFPKGRQYDIDQQGNLVVAKDQ